MRWLDILKCIRCGSISTLQSTSRTSTYFSAGSRENGFLFLNLHHRGCARDRQVLPLVNTHGTDRAHYRHALFGLVRGRLPRAVPPERWALLPDRAVWPTLRVRRRTDHREMNILITGGSGAFGTAFVKTLLHEPNNDRIVVYSRGEHRQADMAQQFAPIDPDERL